MNGDENTNKDLSFIDDMSSELLENLICSDTDSEFDEEVRRYALEVLRKREKTERNVDVDQAWDTFCNEYLPMAGEDPLYPEIKNENLLADEYVPSEKKHHGIVSRSIWKKVASVAAAVVVLLMGTTVTAYACGFDIWGVVAHWTKDTFGFRLNQAEPMQESLDAVETADLAATLLDYGIEEPLVPTWFPEGFSFKEVEVFETPMETCFTAVYIRGEDNIVIDITHMFQISNGTYEIDHNSVKSYISHGVEHFITSNDGEIRTIWFDGANEVSIGGDVTEAELITMIESLYEV